MHMQVDDSYSKVCLHSNVFLFSSVLILRESREERNIFLKSSQVIPKEYKKHENSIQRDKILFNNI